MVTRRHPETLQGRPEWIGDVCRLAMVAMFLEAGAPMDGVPPPSTHQHQT